MVKQFVQRCTDDKNNEITAAQELLKELKIKGNVIVADALNCKKETADKFEKIFGI